MIPESPEKSSKFSQIKKKFSPESRKILANAFWLYLDKVFSKVLTLFVFNLVANYLGPNNLGFLSFVDAIALLLSILAKLGLDQIVIRDIVRFPESKDEILGTTFILKIVGGVITFFLILGTISILRPNDGLSFWLALLSGVVTIFLAFDTIELWFQSQVQSKYIVLARRSAYLLNIIGQVILVNFKAALITFGWLKVIESITKSIGLTSIYSRHHSIKSWRWSSKRAKLLLKESWPLIITSFAIMIYMKIDVVMLGKMVGNEAVGFYSVAVRFSEAWYFIPTSLVSSAFPSVVQAKQISEELYYRRLKKLLKTMMILAYCIAIPMTFISKQLVVSLVGPEYVTSGDILAVHIWAAVFVFMGVVQSPWNISEGLTKLYMSRTVMGAIINVGLNLILIPKYQGLGAAIATIIAYSSSAFFLNAFHPKTRKIFWIQARALVLG